MDATLLLLVLLMPVLLLVIALCSASETTFFSMTRTDRLRLRRRSRSAGAATQRLLHHPRGLVLAILLVTNAGNVTFYVILSVLETRMPHATLGIAFSAAVLLILILVGDLLPKLLAASSPVRCAQWLAVPLEVVVRIVGPVTRFLESWLVAPTLRLIRPRDTTMPHSVTVEELGALLDLSARSGEIQEDEQRLLSDVIRLGSTRVRDIMIPRVAMPWVPERFTPTDVVRALKRTMVDRVPVFRSSPDAHPLGVLDVGQYLAASEVPAEPHQAARDATPGRLEPVAFIPERARMDQLLDLLRHRRCEQALCVDEYGAVVGLVTITEVLRELVATAPGVESGPAASIERRSTTCWVIPGRLPARALAAQLGGAATGSDGVSTVAGLFFQELGRVPIVGDAIRLGNVELRVEAMSGRSIDRVAITLLTLQEDAA